jgi:hypothetical protein
MVGAGRGAIKQGMEGMSGSASSAGPAVLASAGIAGGAIEVDIYGFYAGRYLCICFVFAFVLPLSPTLTDTVCARTHTHTHTRDRKMIRCVCVCTQKKKIFRLARTFQPGSLEVGNHGVRGSGSSASVVELNWHRGGLL